MSSVVSIVGKSGVGKTSLMEKLIGELKNRGYRVAAVKHAPGEVDLDVEGKDSWRFAQAGSEAVLVSSAGKLAFVEKTDHDYKIEQLLRIIGGGFDLVLMEGFKKGKAPKIEVHRKELGEDLVCPVEVLSAVVSDEILDVDVPQFSLDDTQAVADFIEEKFILHAKREASLFVNGKQVFMKPFVEDIIAGALLAMVATLKDIEDIKNIDISIRNGIGSKDV